MSDLIELADLTKRLESAIVDSDHMPLLEVMSVGDTGEWGNQSLVIDFRLIETGQRFDIEIREK